MLHPPRSVAIGAMSALVAISCLPTEPCACPPATFNGVLYGTVSGPGGTPVAGARVVPEHAGPGCAEPVHPLDWAISNADGRYRVDLRTPREPRPGDCLRAVAEPPGESGLLPSGPVSFSLRFAVNRNVDSARVDFVLRRPLEIPPAARVGGAR